MKLREGEKGAHAGTASAGCPGTRRQPCGLTRRPSPLSMLRPHGLLGFLPTFSDAGKRSELKKKKGGDSLYPNFKSSTRIPTTVKPFYGEASRFFSFLWGIRMARMRLWDATRWGAAERPLTSARHPSARERPCWLVPAGFGPTATVFSPWQSHPLLTLKVSTGWQNK